MNKVLAVLALLGVLTSVLAGCGTTPQPTEPPPTQTPWIIIVTATTQPQAGVEVQPTETQPIAATATEPVPGATASLEATVSGPTATVAPTRTVTPKPTSTAEPVTYVYPAPVLLEPPRDRPVSWKSTVLLKWSSVGSLAADEYYFLHVDRPPATPGMTYYGDYVFTKETEYRMEETFLAPFHPPAGEGQAVVYWWVSVVRKTGEDQNGKPIGVEISGPSDKRTLILDPKPEGK